MAKIVKLPDKYQLPEGWNWGSLGDFIQIISGYPFKSECFSNEPDGRKPLIRIRDVIPGTTSTFTNEECPEEYIVETGDILVGMDGDFNVNRWRSSKALLNQRVCKIKSISKQLNERYLYYYLPQPLRVINANTPSVTVKHLSVKTLLQIPIPLPPLEGQERIADFLDQEFQRLDEAKEQVQEVIDNSEERKQAILHKAFTGELTEKWRKETGQSSSKWHVKKFDDLVFSMTNGLAKRHGEIGTETVVLRLADIGNNEIKTDSLRKIKLTDKEREKYILAPEDILMIRVNGSKENVGKQVSIYGKDWAFSDHLIRIKYMDTVLPEYMIFFSKTKKYRDYINENMVSSAGQNTISRKGMQNLVITVPPIDEQKEIVKLLNSCISKEASTLNVSEAVLASIDETKKSLLNKAFHGELNLE